MIIINYWAVLAAAIAQMIIGMFWYSPKVFGKQWMMWSGMTEEKMKATKDKGMGKTYFAAFVGALVASYVLAHFVAYVHAADFGGAIYLAFKIWLGFMATKSLSSVLWEGRPTKLYLLNTIHDLVSISVMSVILALWM